MPEVSECADAAAPMPITVAHSPAPRSVRLFEVRLAVGATLAEAVEQSGVLHAFPTLDWQRAGISVWGRRASASTPLRAGDRVELCRPLRVDPKTARRERFARQGVRASGLFAQPTPSDPGAD